MRRVIEAWKKLQDEYDRIKSILLEEKVEGQNKILNNEDASKVLISFGKAKEEVLRAIRSVTENPNVYQQYQKPLEDIKNWINSHGESLKKEFINFTQFLSFQEKLASPPRKNSIQKSSSTLKETKQGHLRSNSTPPPIPPLSTKISHLGRIPFLPMTTTPRLAPIPPPLPSSSPTPPVPTRQMLPGLGARVVLNRVDNRKTSTTTISKGPNG